MENIFQLLINAMGWSMVHSLWQGASLYIILYGLFLIFYNWSPDTKYKVAYFFQSLIFISFITTFVKTFNISTGVSLPNSTSQEVFYSYIDKLQNSNWSITKLFPYMVIIYTIGIIVQTFLCIKSFDWLKKIKQTSSQIIPTEWLNILEEIKNNHNISSKVRLLTSPKIESPITIGFLKPLIIFPTAYINSISTEEAEAILLHEIAHIRRHDYLFNIILISIETTLFFNPFIWLVSRHIKVEREQSCDDFVTTHIPNPIIYAKTLLHVEVLRNAHQTTQALALSGDNKYDLLNRIKRINKQIMESKYTSYKQQLGVIICASLTFIFIAWANPNNKQNQQVAINEIVISKIENIETIDTTIARAEQRSMPVKKKTLLKDTSTIIVHEFENNEEIKPNKHIESVEKLLNSKNFKIIIANIEEGANAIERKLNSTEWKDKMTKIELKTQESLDEYYNSEEWKDKMAQIEINTQKILEEKFNSPEWKDKMAKIEIKTQKILEETFNSLEWKKKIQDLEKLHNSN